MKRIAFALLASAAAWVATSARADTRVSIGVNIGGPSYRPAPPAVMYAPAPAVVVAPHGYWKEVQVRTWVPERWVVRHSRWGRPERYCEPGYYTFTTNRVWVDGRNDHRHGHHYDRSHGYDRRDDRRDDRHDNRRDDRGRWHR